VKNYISAGYIVTDQQSSVAPETVNGLVHLRDFEKDSLCLIARDVN